MPGRDQFVGSESFGSRLTLRRRVGSLLRLLVRRLLRLLIRGLLGLLGLRQTTRAVAAPTPRRRAATR